MAPEELSGKLDNLSRRLAAGEITVKEAMQELDTLLWQYDVEG